MRQQAESLGGNSLTLPNFLLLGAAKSGTVSLYHYLAQHPEIYMSPVNETNFLALDGFDLDAHFQGPGDRAALDAHCIFTPAAYRRLFKDATPAQTVGEGSPLYLYSTHAPARIQHYLPHARLIVILRHPTERAFSNYRHHRMAGLEPLPSFAAALAAESARRQAHWGPWPFWAYKDVGHYATQLARYDALFAPGQLLICLYDELQADPVRLLQKIYAFIGVDDTFVPDVRVRHNIGSQAYLPWLHRLMTRPNPFKRTVRALLPDPVRVRLRDALHRWNSNRSRLDPVLAQALTEAYRDDIRWLEKRLDRDLTHWLP